MSQTAYRTHHATEVTEQLVGQKVTLAGWVDRRRDHGGVAFIDLRDNTGLVQVVIPYELSLYEKGSTLTVPDELKKINVDSNPIFIVYKLREG